MLELVLAVVVSAASVAVWLASRSTRVNPPVGDGEPATTSIAYYPPLMMLAFLLCALAGSLWVVAIARWLRSRRSAAVDSALRTEPSPTFAP